MADLIKIGERLINLDQITKVILDYVTRNNEIRVMIYFSDGREGLLDEDGSARFRAYIDRNISQGDERRIQGY